MKKLLSILVLLGGLAPAARAVLPPVPAAVWDGDFPAESETRGAWTLSVNGNDVAADGSQITIGAATYGVLLDRSESLLSPMVVVRYSNLAYPAVNKGAVMATAYAGRNTSLNVDRTGISCYTTSGRARAIYNGANSSTAYDAGTGEFAPAGVFAFAYETASATHLFDATGTALYSAALRSTTDNRNLGFAIGGFRGAVSKSPIFGAAGLKIHAIAVFDRILTPAEIEAFRFDSDYADWPSFRYAGSRVFTWAADSEATLASAEQQFVDVFTGKAYAGAGADYVLPGCEVSAPFWQALAFGQDGFTEPGVVLAFDSRAKDRVLKAGFSPLTLGGLRVFPDAGGALGADGASAGTILGSCAGAVEACLQAESDFAVSRPGWLRLVGTNVVEVAAGKRLSLNVGGPADSQPVVCAAITALQPSGAPVEVPGGCLRFRGEGQLEAETLVATNGAAVDYSGIPAARLAAAAPLLGRLVVDETTTVNLPADARPGVPYRLASAIDGAKIGRLQVGGVDLPAGATVILGGGSGVVAYYDSIVEKRWLGTSSDWNEDTNWSPSGVPAANAIVRIEVEGDRALELPPGGNVSVVSVVLTGSGRLAISGGAFSALTFDLSGFEGLVAVPSEGLVLNGGLVGKIRLDVSAVTAGEQVPVLTGSAAAGADFEAVGELEGRGVRRLGDILVYGFATEFLRYGYAFNGNGEKRATAEASFGNLDYGEWTYGVGDQAVKFTGRDDCRGDTGLDVGTGDFTLVAVVKAPTAAKQVVLGFGRGDEPGGLALVSNGSRGLRLRAWSEAATIDELMDVETSMAEPVDATTGYHVYAVQYVVATSRLRISVDGAAYADVEADFAYGNPAGWQIGGLLSPPAGLVPAAGGSLDELRVYSRRLTDAQLKGIVNEFVPHKYLATASGNVVSWEALVWTDGETGQVAEWFDSYGNEPILTLDGDVVLTLGRLVSAGPLTLRGNGRLIVTDWENFDTQALKLEAGASYEHTVPAGEAVFALPVSGAGTFVKSGPGTLTLTAPSPRTGATVVREGLLVAGAEGAVSGSATVVDGATLDLNGTSGLVSLTLAGRGDGATRPYALTTTAGDTGFIPTVRLAGDTTVHCPHAVVFGGNWTAATLSLGGFTLTKTGEGRLWLPNAQTDDGTLDIVTGELFCSQWSCLNQGNLGHTRVIVRAPAALTAACDRPVSVYDLEVEGTCRADAAARPFVIRHRVAGTGSVNFLRLANGSSYDCSADVLTVTGRAEAEVNASVSLPSAVYEGVLVLRLTQGATAESLVAAQVALFSGSTPVRDYRLHVADDGGVRLKKAYFSPVPVVEDVWLKYGADMADASIWVSIAGYAREEGAGPSSVTVKVFDGDECLVIASQYVDGEGEYEMLRDVSLLGRLGHDLRYEVKVEARASATAPETQVIETGAAGTVAHGQADWFAETATTFKEKAYGGIISRSKDVWSWGVGGASPMPLVGHAYASNDMIRVKCTSAAEDGELGQCVNFTPAREANEDIVTMEVRFRVDDDSSSGLSAAEGTKGMFHVEDINGLEPEVLVFDPETRELVPVEGYSGSEATDATVMHHLVATYNYTKRTLAYELDGCLLTDAAHPDGHFAIPADAERVQGLGFSGIGYVDRATGSEFSTNLVEVVSRDGSQTNLFTSVEAAVAAARAAGVTNVTLLWDASWSPSAADFGSPIFFGSPAGRSFELFVDPAATNRLAQEGYRLVRREDGAYSVELVSYEVTYNSNFGGEPRATERESFVVTNGVLRIRENPFVNPNYDFAGWNEAPNGTGVGYAAGEVIALTNAVLRDFTLYAQWRLTVHMIVVERAVDHVYIEQVSTNGVDHGSVRYFADKTLIPVEHGSDVVIRYSTDLERRLTFDRLQRDVEGQIYAAETVRRDQQPVLYTNEVEQVFTEIQYWALMRGISLQDLAASAYGRSSYRLNAANLLTAESQVEIRDFRVEDQGCSFRVTVDGSPLRDITDLSGMIKVSQDLAAGPAGWADATDVVLGADGRVFVRTGTPGAFVKLVIPSN